MEMSAKRDTYTPKATANEIQIRTPKTVRKSQWEDVSAGLLKKLRFHVFPEVQEGAWHISEGIPFHNVVATTKKAPVLVVDFWECC